MHKNNLSRYYATLALAGLLFTNATPGMAAWSKTKHHAYTHHAYTPRHIQKGHPAGVASLPAGIEKPTHQIDLSIGEGAIINLPAGVTNVWTSNAQAADVYVNNNHQIHLFGKAFGESTVFATAASGAVIYSSQIRVAQNISSLDSILKSAFPEDDIHVSVAGQVAVLTGTVHTPMDSSQAEGLVKSALNPGVKPESTDALKFAVINRLRTATPLQVMLRVRIAEVNRNYTKTLQSSLASATANPTNGFQWGIGQGSVGTNTGQFSSNLLGVGITPSTIGMTGTAINPVTGQVTPTLGVVPGISVSVPSTGTALGLAGKLFGLDLIAALNAGEQAGLVTTLAEPTLTAISGETAEFLAGGQYPIPVLQGSSSGSSGITITYQNYGVSLSYTPTVLADGNISLRVRPEVSELNNSGAVQMNGFSVPGLTIRRAETTVELGSGQSFMIAGLLQNSASNTIQKLPGAGDVPVLGNLFKSTNFQRGETELVIVVTPFLVKPVNDRDIKLPTDGYQNPSDAQRLLANMFSNGTSGTQRPEPTSASRSSTAAKAPSAPGFTAN